METMASSTVEGGSKSLKRKNEKENVDPETLHCSPPTKLPSILSDNPQVKDIKIMMSDLSQEIILLFSKYAEALSECATEDLQNICELDEILKEARSLEAQIRQKKENLRNDLSMITKTLQK
ncbi:testis-expressed protein 12 [Eleutherodactylus coqui]|uniref:testis-expressed protein 12 n=1 Tax=Eleutherodactylus coqui TaxID=57060 RepID=UPI003461A836